MADGQMRVAEYYHESGRGGGEPVSVARIFVYYKHEDYLTTIEIWAVFVPSVNQRKG